MISLFFFVLLADCLITCISRLPDIDQIVFINSSQYNVITPTQIHFINRKVPNYYLHIENKFDTTGEFYQLSNIFSRYGYNPCKGKEIFNSTIITDMHGRFVYKLREHSNNQLISGTFDVVNIRIDLIDNNNKNISLCGKIFFLPQSGIFVSSDFLLNDDGWTIVNNHPIHTPIQEPIYCSWTFKTHSMFITGTDNYVNYDTRNNNDISLWYFKAPGKYHMDLSLAYSGWIEFSQVFLSGDFSKLNNLDAFPIVRIECYKLSYSIEHYSSINHANNSTYNFTIKLDERLWTKAYNKYKNKNKPNILKKEFIQCLANINSFEILGDWTTGIETVGLDSVSVYIQPK